MTEQTYDDSPSTLDINNGVYNATVYIFSRNDAGILRNGWWGIGTFYADYSTIPQEENESTNTGEE